MKGLIKPVTAPPEKVKSGGVDCDDAVNDEGLAQPSIYVTEPGPSALCAGSSSGASAVGQSLNSQTTLYGFYKPAKSGSSDLIVTIGSEPNV